MVSWIIIPALPAQQVAKAVMVPQPQPAIAVKHLIQVPTIILSMVLLFVSRLVQMDSIFQGLNACFVMLTVSHALLVVAIV